MIDMALHAAPRDDHETHSQSVNTPGLYKTVKFR
jgi:hypothetical protein